MKHEPTAWIEGNEPLVGWAAPKPKPAVTQYINIILEMVRNLHAAYPDQQIELRTQEIEPGGWQCYIELREHGIKVASESFYINPPGI